jgi:hypothetical protein
MTAQSKWWIIGTSLCIIAVIFVIVQINQSRVPQSQPIPALVVKQTPAQLVTPPPVLSESTKRKQGLVGPFPISVETPEQARAIGQLMNAWREAIISKNIEDINRINLSFNHYGVANIPFLKELSSKDQNERVRAFATRVLGKMKVAELQAFFIDLLQQDASSFVRGNAAWALGNLGNVNALPVLRITVDSDESDKVRASAQEAIKAIEKSGKTGDK